MGSNGVMLLIIIICVILSGYFSATETAFSAINRVRIRNQAEKGNKRAALVLQLSDNYDSLLSTILIGNNIVNIGCSSLATILFVKLLGEERKGKSIYPWSIVENGKMLKNLWLLRIPF